MPQGVTWRIFDEWTVSTSPGAVDSWSAVEPLLDAAARSVEAAVTTLEERLEVSDRALCELGGDPSRVDWHQFRPLRLSREEDWSDWLSWLLEDSQTGVFAARLLLALGVRSEPDTLLPMRVEREVQVSAGERRADLLVTWGRERALGHIEVKIADTNRAKTFDTARRLEAERGVSHHFLLLRDEDVGAWTVERDAHPGEADIPFFTWRDVSRALRFALSMKAESIRWRVFAHAFVGAVEQEILGHPRISRLRTDGMSISHLDAFVSLLDLLELEDRNEA